MGRVGARRAASAERDRRWCGGPSRWHSISGDIASTAIAGDDRGERIRSSCRALGRPSGKVLAERYHLRVLASATQVRNALAYVLLNARRHAAKRMAKLRKLGKTVAPIPRNGILDAASSARWFFEWRGDLALDRSPPPALGGEPAVAAPTTFFLRGGWRRAGPLLDPNDIPGAAKA